MNARGEKRGDHDRLPLGAVNRLTRHRRTHHILNAGDALLRKEGAGTDANRPIAIHQGFLQERLCGGSVQLRQGSEYGCARHVGHIAAR